MKHPSVYLDWYVHVPKVKYDLRSSGIAYFEHEINLNSVDLGVNYAHGNPETLKIIARRYDTKPENVFVSSEGASGQNARLMRILAEMDPNRSEVIVEYPTYEPLLRLAQEYFEQVRRLERRECEGYRLDADVLRKIASDKTGLLVISNPHAPSGAVSDRGELGDIATVAREHGFYVLCDEIYAEFDRATVPMAFSVAPDQCIVTTSFTKAYGLGGLKLGVALAARKLVDEFYVDVLNTVGNSPNVVQLIAANLLTEGREDLESHKRRWLNLKTQTEEWLEERNLDYFPSRVGITYWVKTEVQDTYSWTNEIAVRSYSLAPVPGTFFMFRNDYKLVTSRMIRLGLGNLVPDSQNLSEALDVLEKTLRANGSG